MSWLREINEKWLRILTVSGDRSLTPADQTRLIGEVNGPVQLRVKVSRTIWPWQRGLFADTLDTAGPAALTTLNQHLMAAMLTTEHLVGRIQQLTGET